MSIETNEKVWEADISTAADLLKALTALADQGYDLSAMYVQNGVGEDFGSFEVVKKTLTDKSEVHDLRFFLHGKYQ